MAFIWGLICILLEYALLYYWIVKIELAKHTIYSKTLWRVLHDIESHKDVKEHIRSLNPSILVLMAGIGIVVSIFIHSGLSSAPPGKWVGIGIGIYGIWFMNKKFIWDRYSDYLRQWVTELSILLSREGNI